MLEKAVQYGKHKKTGSCRVTLFPLTEGKRENTGNCPYINNGVLKTLSNICDEEFLF